MIQLRHTCLAVLLALPLSCANAESTDATRPNIVIIYADDLGYGDLSCYGATKVKTPNIDRLAAGGRRFTDGHSAASLCTPSRFALLTGEYPFRKGVYKPIFLRDPLLIPEDRFTIADLMQQSGYKTGIIGKWHLGFQNQAPTLPREHVLPNSPEIQTPISRTERSKRTLHPHNFTISLKIPRKLQTDTNNIPNSCQSLELYSRAKGKPKARPAPSSYSATTSGLTEITPPSRFTR